MVEVKRLSVGWMRTTHTMLRIVETSVREEEGKRRGEDAGELAGSIV